MTATPVGVHLGICERAQERESCDIFRLVMNTVQELCDLFPNMCLSSRKLLRVLEKALMKEATNCTQKQWP